MRVRGRRAGTLALLLSAWGCRGRPAPPPPDVLRVAAPFELTTLDPHAKDLLSHHSLLANVYESLVFRDAEMALGPALAARWTSPDPLTWVFELRPGVTFHDGGPLEAADVAATLERILRDGSLETGFYGRAVSRVRALDARTVEVKTAEPSAVLLNKLAFIPIVPRDAATRPLASHADGTGPYRVAEWAPGSRLRLVRNEAYWGPKPPFREVLFRLTRSPGETVGEFAAGRVDLARVTGADLPDLSAAPRHGVVRRPSIFVRFLGFDVQRLTSPYVSVTPNPFRSREVRTAVSLALDRRRLLPRGASRPLPATQLVPAFIFGFDPSLRETVADLEGARARMAAAGLASGFEVTLHVREVVADTAGQVRELLAPLGIRVNVAALPDAEYFALARGERPSFFLSRFGCSTGDASDLFDSALHTPDATRHLGSANAGGVSDPEVDRLIAESASVADVATRRSVLQRLMRHVLDRAYWLPLVLDEDVYLVRDGLAFSPRADGYLVAAEVGWGAPPGPRR
ncbi:MAG: hypothetical protein EDX89_03965 [Acidobacteria bacterium]|nr:MAG: hypothetical protein EDX89_03965 [Acidobacteriota bacterium]MCE7957645.1 hypothetical protein [Acidobacteria bacterium ACB2]